MNNLIMERSETVANCDEHDSQKEQARERRRIYARERRHSMSVEEKQRYLARRRMNYQLQRQREENCVGSFHGRMKRRVKFENENLSGNNDLSLDPKLESIVQSDGASLVEDVSQLENRHASCSTDAIPHKHPENPGRLSLNQIKRLARSINNSASKPVAGCHESGADVLTNQCTGMRGKAMRLVHVKQLARSLKPLVQKASDADN